MNRNSKISEISNNVFNYNFKILQGKSLKQIIEQKEFLEDELNRAINELDKETRKELLDVFLKESENGQVSFFDSDGSINAKKIKGAVELKAKKIKSKKKEIEKEDSEASAYGKENKNIEETANFKISDKAKEETISIFDNFSKLSAEEKDRFIEEVFEISKEKQPEKVDIIKLHMEYREAIHEYAKKNNCTIYEASLIIGKEEKYGSLTEEQKGVAEDGETMLEKYMQYRVQLKMDKEEYDRIKLYLQDIIEGDWSSNIILKEAKSHIENLNKEKYKLGLLLGIEERKEYELDSSEIEKYNKRLKDFFNKDTSKRKESEFDFDVSNIKTLKDVEKLGLTDFLANDVKDSIDIFRTALEESETIEEFNENMQKLSESSNTIVKSMLKAMTSLQYENELEKILSTDEKIDLIDQLLEITEKIEERENKEEVPKKVSESKEEKSKQIMNQNGTSITEEEFDETFNATEIEVSRRKDSEMEKGSVLPSSVKIERIESDAVVTTPKQKEETQTKGLTIEKVIGFARNNTKANKVKSFFRKIKGMNEISYAGIDNNKSTEIGDIA